MFRMARSPQVSEALFILREAANGLRVVHGHQVRLPGSDLGFHGLAVHFFVWPPQGFK